MPPQPRYFAVDEGPFSFDQATVPIAGVLTRGALVVEAVTVDDVTVDGWDATDTLIELVGRLPGAGPDYVLTDGITLGGMNLLDLDRVHRTLGRPVLALTRQAPDRARMEQAARATRDPERRLALLPAKGPVAVEVDGRRLYVQPYGVDADPRALAVILAPAMHQGGLPEPLRLAHHMATALVRGVSGTKA